MFNRMTANLAALPPKTRLNIFRSLLEGDLSLEQVINADKQNALGTLTAHTSQSSEFTPSIESAPPASSVLKHVNNHNVQLTRKQLTVGFAIQELVNVLAFHLYAIQEAQTETQCHALISLKVNLLLPVNINHAPMLAVITEFQKFLSVLLHSWIETETREFAEMVATYTLDVEVTRRTPINKMLQNLYDVRDRLKKDVLISPRSIFAKLSHANAEAICRHIDSLAKEIDISGSPSKDLIQLVYKAHSEVSTLITNACNSAFKPEPTGKLWDELNQLISKGVPINKLQSIRARK